MMIYNSLLFVLGFAFDSTLFKAVVDSSRFYVVWILIFVCIFVEYGLLLNPIKKVKEQNKIYEEKEFGKLINE